MRTKKVEVIKDRWTDGLALEISHNGWQTTSISSILKKKFGISDSAITRIINLKSKPKFGNYKFKAIYQDIMNDYQEGMLVRDICNKYSIGHTTLNNYLRRLNIVRHR